VIGMAKGMATTLRHMLRPSITGKYPWGPRPLPERSRMSFALEFDEHGEPRCKACLLCEKSCPDGAIRITSEKNEDGPGRVLTGYEIDLGLCMYCGICVESCTSSGLRHTGDFETCAPTRDAMTLVLYRAQGRPHAPLDETPAGADVEPSPAGPEGGAAT
jgi:NADH-quinone oxidoreductase subunit I